MLHPELYKALIKSSFKKNIKTNEPKKPKRPNGFVVFLIFSLLLLGFLIAYNFHFIN